MLPILACLDGGLRLLWLRPSDCSGSGTAGQFVRQESFARHQLAVNSRVTGDEGAAGLQSSLRRMSGDRPRRHSGHRGRTTVPSLQQPTGTGSGPATLTPAAHSPQEPLQGRSRRSLRPLLCRPPYHVRSSSLPVLLLSREPWRFEISPLCGTPPPWMPALRHSSSKQRPTSWQPAASLRLTIPQLQVDRSRTPSDPWLRQSMSAACRAQSKSCRCLDPHTSARQPPCRPSSSLAWPVHPMPCGRGSFHAWAIQCLPRSGHTLQ